MSNPLYKKGQRLLKSVRATIDHTGIYKWEGKFVPPGLFGLAYSTTKNQRRVRIFFTDFSQN